MTRKAVWLVLILLVLLPATSWAALPLITDDTGTQGKGKYQVEVGAELDRDRETFEGVTVTENDYVLGVTLTFGVTETVDLFVAAPYAWTAVSDDQGGGTRTSGIGDTSIGAKWRFFDREGISLGLKPFVTLPSGNDSKTLGSGKIDYGFVFVTSAEQDPWAVHLNLGYFRNENTLGERKDIWNASVATVFSVSKHWKVCADIGTLTNTDRTTEREPRYILGGAIYSPNDNLELSVGLKQGLTDEEADWAVLPGVTYRF